MNEPQRRLYHSHLIVSHVCAQCWGPLVERWDGTSYMVACPRGCQPGGFVTIAYAEHRQAEAAWELAEVAANYPELCDQPHPSEQQRVAATRALFGE